MLYHTSPISGIASYKNQWIATAGYDNRIILWDAKTHRPLFRAWHDHLVNHCDFSSCGNYLLSASSDYTARLWSTNDLSLISVLNVHKDDVEKALFHPTKPLIATCSRDHTVALFDFSGQLLHHLKGHQADVIAIGWDESCNHLLSSGDDGVIYRWDIDTGSLVDCINLGDIETDALTIAAGGEFYAGNDEGRIVICKNNKITNHPAHKAGVKNLALSADKNYMISLSYDRTFKLWQLGSTLDLILEENFPAITWPRSCAFLDNKTLIFGSFGDRYVIYDLHKKKWIVENIQPTIGINAITTYLNQEYAVGDAGHILHNNKIIGSIDSLCNFIICSDKNKLFCGGQLGVIYDEKGNLLYQHNSPLNCAALFKKMGNEYLAVGSYTGEALIYKLTNKQLQLEQVLKLHINAIKGICADDLHIFSVCASGDASWVSIDNFKQEHYIKHAHTKIANGCTSLSDGHFASISRDLKLRVWANKKEVLIDTPHTHSIKCVAASSCGRFIATGSYNGLFAMYDRLSGAWSQQRLTTSGLSSISFNSLTSSFHIGSYNGKIYIESLLKTQIAA